MMGLAAETWGSIGTVAGVFGMGVSFIYGRIAAGDKRAHDLEIEQMTNNINRIENNQKTAWSKIDELRENAVHKSDLKEYRSEVKQDMKDLGDRLEAAIAALRKDIRISHQQS
jgi:predicted lipase